MIRVYIAQDLADAHLLCHRIRDSGIAAHIFNEHADGAVGELPFTHTYPEIWVENERDCRNAQKIIAICQAQPAADQEWRCAVCSELNPANFEICWNCSATSSSE